MGQDSVSASIQVSIFLNPWPWCLCTTLPQQNSTIARTAMLLIPCWLLDSRDYVLLDLCPQHSSPHQARGSLSAPADAGRSQCYSGWHMSDLAMVGLIPSHLERTPHVGRFPNLLCSLALPYSPCRPAPRPTFFQVGFSGTCTQPTSTPQPPHPHPVHIPGLRSRMPGSSPPQRQRLNLTCLLVLTTEHLTHLTITSLPFSGTAPEPLRFPEAK